MTDKKKHKAKSADEIRSKIRERYGAIAQSGTSCCDQGASCCSVSSQPDISQVLGYSDAELSSTAKGANMGLGCGNPLGIASLKPGDIVLDLGCGGGFDCFLAAQAVGKDGFVIGVDMTPNMIDKARSIAGKEGYSNVEFRLGEIEHLPVADATVDIVISNCVINLSPHKQQVFWEIYRVLRKEGRVAIADIVALQNLPEEIRTNQNAYSGCVAGAALVKEVEEMLKNAGFKDIIITVKEESREYIKNWFPGSGVENFVRSAYVEAKK
ncbi:arsenite methyltransferase [Aminobacterium sp. EBM-42]|uniref:arsenite methyltransferase n=1 Tax=Aminobacterium sp. EBM-42 TaxID=1918503 RepID=UPI00257B503F|nr:arsenite methyltransferase [Aminobacterium sp. EBM-42]MDD4586064.1 arsenite methyltransferase [Aminobacterium colombiense]